MDVTDQAVSLYRIRQHFPRPRIDAVESELLEQLRGAGVPIQSGSSVAVAVGSRGIANLEIMVRTLVGWVRAQGGEPFIVPAMGSHGGATAAGQRAVLEGYGISEQNVGAPIRSSMDVVELPSGDCPGPVYFDRYAAAADATIVLNRIKPHTSFHGTYESGLMKMLVIGLGKHRQALAVHNRGVEGLRDLMPRVARQVLAGANVILGVAVVENAYDETQVIAALPAPEIAKREPELLELARRSMPCLPVDSMDILMVDRFGKDISGVGLDTNIIGRLMIHGQEEPAIPDIAIIVLRDLSDGSHGNACGMGLADIMLQRAYAKVDLQATYANIHTSGFLVRGKIPVLANNDRDALRFALRGAMVPNPADTRLVRIRDTLHLGEMLVSRSVLDELADAPNIEHMGAACSGFDADGFLAPV